MRALLCETFGPPENLMVREFKDPVPGRGAVLVKVTAAALNFFDTLIIENRYQFKPQLPFSPGGELAGRIVAVGRGVTDFSVGDRVAAYVGWGACRSHIIVRTDQLIRIPDTLSEDTAAALLVTYGTSLHALRDRAALKPGETLAVLGASGGVGLAAVELGAQMGARVIACASSGDKLDLARKHGAHEGLVYNEHNLREGLKGLAPDGVDVIYDPVGGDYTEQALRSIGWKGRFLVVGFAAGTIPKLPLNLVLLKGCDVLGVFWGAFAEKEPEKHRLNTAQLFQWAAEGKITVHISATYPLERGPEALRVIAERRVTGKVIIKP